MRIAAALIVTVLVLRTLLFLHASPAVNSTQWLYYSTFSRADTLLLGAWVALWLRGVRMTGKQLRQLSTAVLAGGAVVLAAVLSVTHGWGFEQMNAGVVTVGYTLIGCIAVGALLRSLDSDSRLHRLLLWAPLKQLGRISYGFYFVQGLLEPVAVACARQWLQPRGLTWLILPISLLVICAFAWASYVYLESPFLRWKRRLAPDHPSVPSGREAALLSPISVLKEEL